MFKFSKTSKKTFDKKNIQLWSFYDAHEGMQVIDLTYDTENNDCSSGLYTVEAVLADVYRFTLVPATWNDPQLPNQITGEVDFRRMVAKLDIEKLLTYEGAF
jgi:hypothetical protein